MLRVVGIGLVLLVSIPLIVAFPPLLILPLGLLLLSLGRGRRAPSRRKTAKRGSLVSRRPPAKSRAARGSPSRRARGRAGSPLLRKIVLWLLAGLIVVSFVRALFVEYPAATMVLVISGLGVTALAIARRQRRPAPNWNGHRGFGMVARHPSTVATGTAFEWHVVDILQSLGYRQVERVAGTGDNGIDIVARDKRGQTFLVQCKNFNGGKVGSVDIQKLLGAVVHHGADGGMFFTTSAYTNQAVNLASSGRVPITLFDGNQVARLSR